MSNNEALNTIDYLRIVMDYLAIDEKEFSQIRRRNKGNRRLHPGSSRKLLLMLIGEGHMAAFFQ